MHFDRFPNCQQRTFWVLLLQVNIGKIVEGSRDLGAILQYPRPTEGLLQHPLGFVNLIVKNVNQRDADLNSTD